MARLRVATVGAGFYSRFHHEAWSRIAEIELVAVCDADAGKAAGVAREWGIPRVFGDAVAMLEAVRPDLLDIVTPPSAHLALIGAAAARGIDVICQKPFCRSLDEAAAAVEVAAGAGVRLIVHENFRFQPWYREIARQLAAGRIGEPYGIGFRLRPGDGQGPDAYLGRQPYFRAMPRFLVRETGVHFIDVFRFLFGEIEAVYARLARLNPAIAGEDAGVIVFDFVGGRRGVFDGNRLVDHAAENPRLTLGEMLVEGSEGVLRLDGDGRVWFRAFGSPAETAVPFVREPGATGGGSVLALQRHVVAHVLRGAPVENAGRAYLVNRRVEEAVYASAESGMRVVVGG